MSGRLGLRTSWVALVFCSHKAAHRAPGMGAFYQVGPVIQGDPHRLAPRPRIR